jgi:hypothetical protein
MIRADKQHGQLARDENRINAIKSTLHTPAWHRQKRGERVTKLALISLMNFLVLFSLLAGHFALSQKTPRFSDS